MKILLAHNEYGKYSGEEAVVDKMEGIFSSLGHEVVRLRKSTANSRDSFTGKLHGFVAGIYCPSGIKAMSDIIRCERPDIVNVHNLYPYISPAALRECKKAGIPVIMTIHNFRLICPTGLFMRNNRPCELCLEKGNEWGCIAHNCEHSIMKSAGYAARNAVARRNRYFHDCVDRFACITNFQREKLIQAGFDEQKLVTIPNSMDCPTGINSTIGNYVAFCGRISEEKGVDMIIETARRHPEIPFRLAGEIRDTALLTNIPSNVQLTGYLSGDSLAKFYKNARFMVMASRCYEGFPMSILEGAKYAKATVAPDHGGFTEIIGHGEDGSGLLFDPGDTNGLEKHIVTLWNNHELAMHLGKRAYLKLTQRFSIERVSLMWNSLLNELYKQR